MAENLHIKTFFKSRIDGKMQSIDVFSDLDDDLSEASLFFYGVNYDFFCLFGSTRGEFKQADADGYGIHKSIIDDCKTFNALARDKNFNNYDFRWFTFAGLQKMLKKYKARLNRPKEYFCKDEDEYVDIKEGIFDFDNWYSIILPIVELIDKMLLMLRKFKQTYESNIEFYSKYFSLDDIIIQTWLDS